MWAALLRQIVYGVAHVALTFLWEKFDKYVLRKKKKQLDEKIDAVEKKVYADEKKFLDDLADIDKQL